MTLLQPADQPSHPVSPILSISSHIRVKYISVQQNSHRSRNIATRDCTVINLHACDVS